MLKTLFFDIGNVLFLFDFRKMVQEMGSCSLLSPKEVRALLQQAHAKEKYSLGQWTAQDLFNLIQQHSPKKIVWTEFASALSNAFVPNTALWTLIEKLKKHPVRLMILSNTSEHQYHHFKQTYSFFDLFDDQVLSFELGIQKPNLRIFETALSLAQAPPHECFYIDDVPLFIESAKKVGLEGTVYTSQESLERELQQRDLII